MLFAPVLHAAIVIAPWVVLDDVGAGFVTQAVASQPTSSSITRETPDEARRRHERVAERRGRVHIICHRGAQEFALENTLEAYRATLELGGDGNEIDIRRTKDGVLVCFHDDMLDRLVDAYGTVPEVTWAALQSFQFRDPGPFGNSCRVPALVEVMELHRKFAGLLHLDIKEAGLDQAIAELLDRFDMWDHVAYCNSDNAASIVANAKLQLSRYKAGLYSDRAEVDPVAIAEALQRPGNGLIVEDPRGVLIELGRSVGSVSMEPVLPEWHRPVRAESRALRLDELMAILGDADDWNRVAGSAEDQAQSGARIRERARAAEQMLAVATKSESALTALEERVRHRSLHKDWMFHGFDGAMSLRTLILLHAPRAVELARTMLWLDDEQLEPVHNKEWNTPRSWTDFRVKMVVFPSLEKFACPQTEQLCRDYLALADDEARRIGPTQFEAAAKTLITVSPTTETSLELMGHRLREVRGRAILQCVKHSSEPWARMALEQAAPQALQYIASVRSKQN